MLSKTFNSQTLFYLSIENTRVLIMTDLGSDITIILNKTTTKINCMTCKESVITDKYKYPNQIS